MPDGKIEAILITVPAKFFKEYPGGEKQFRKILEGLNKTDAYQWGNTCGAGIPKIPVKYCYLVFQGKIQYRTEIARFERNKSMEFNDGGITRVFRHKNWVWLQGPVERAPRDIPRKGFQGFRYSEWLF